MSSFALYKYPLVRAALGVVLVKFWDFIVPLARGGAVQGVCMVQHLLGPVTMGSEGPAKLGRRCELFRQSSVGST